MSTENTPKNGGPAFPQDFPDLGFSVDGISKLDFFAAAALKGLLSNPRFNASSDQAIVVNMFDIASVMLAESQKRSK